MDEENRQDLPLISVVIPVYNAEKFLEKTVESVLVQTYPNLEILLVDDGSSDGSLALCMRLETEDPRIHAFHKENGGAASARNLGIRNARGRYIGFVDSDDIIYPDMYENLYLGAKRAERQHGEHCLVQTGREEINEEGERLPDAVVPPKEEKFVSGPAFAESLLLYRGDASFCTALLPAPYMKQHLFTEGEMGEDFALLMHMVDTMDGVLRLPQRGYRVVHRAGSATRRKNPSQFSRVYVDIVKHADYVEREMVPRYPELKAAALYFGLYERLDYLLHVPIPDMTGENAFYQSVLRYIRHNYGKMLKNPYITGKNRLYLTLFAAAPKKTRQVHWALRKKAILADTQAR